MINRDLIEDFFSREVEFQGIERELKIPKTRKIVSIVGPRRAGKTWLFYYLFKKLKNAAYMNFEDVAFRNLETEEFFDVIKIFSELKYKPDVFLLDEVQVINNWETLVRSLHDRGYEIFVTGSSSKLLPKEIATQLRGRTLTYLLFPFSFKEFFRAKNLTFDIHTFEGKGRILKFLREYLEFGGFPEVVLSDTKEKILRQYSDEIFYKDFVERHRIKSFDFGRFLFEFSFQNFSNEISLRKIKRFFGKNISDRTLYEYCEKLQDTMVVFFLEKFSKSVYLRKSWPRKIYVCDLGISKVLGFSQDLGKRMENLVFVELMRKTNENSLLSFYYWKNLSEEVDFVVKEGLKVKQLVQVSYVNGKDEIEKREIKALIKASEILKCKNLLIITWDYEGALSVEGKKIKCLPLWEWLLI